MKRLSEFKTADEGYYLRDLQVFYEYVEAERNRGNDRNARTTV